MNKPESSGHERAPHQHQGIFLWAEMRESFSMAMGAVTAHKLRSALTLLGVLIGVFSIIVTMTAMRVLQQRAITNLQQLGSQTFAVQKWPQVQFGMERDYQKYWRRKNITLANAQQVQDKATLADSVCVECNFWGGEIESRFQKSAPGVNLLGESSGSFPAHTWILSEGRGLSD
ncbi:MAG TPA: ABC transporter permease, partial [Verrucomicrobiae bacterium]|nr:ABC transporter permease [Verrucomicrobiae bacterium]